MARTIMYEVNFNDRSSANKANKMRRLEVNRSEQRKDITGLLKPSSSKGCGIP